MSKELVLKQIEGRIDTMQNLAIESIELIYNAGYNDGIEASAEEAAKTSHILLPLRERIRSLKK